MSLPITVTARTEPSRRGPGSDRVRQGKPAFWCRRGDCADSALLWHHGEGC